LRANHRHGAKIGGWQQGSHLEQRSHAHAGKNLAAASHASTTRPLQVFLGP